MVWLCWYLLVFGPGKKNTTPSITLAEHWCSRVIISGPMHDKIFMVPQLHNTKPDAKKYI